MKSASNEPEDKKLRSSVLEFPKEENKKAFDRGQFLATLAASLTNALKIIILVIVLLTIIFIFLKIYSQQGIVVLPFEMGTNKNLSGVAMADQITAELIRINKIHNTNYEEEAFIKNETEFKAEIPTALYLEKGGMIVPKKEFIKFSMDNTGTISTNYGTLDPGKIIIAFKDICPGSKPDTIIRGSLQKYGSVFMLVAVLEGDSVNSWTVRRAIYNDEGQIQEMIQDLAFMIAFDLPESTISSKTWEGFRYYTEALDAYNQYRRTKNREKLFVAGNYSLKSIEFEKEYQNPFDLLLALELTYIIINDTRSAIDYCNKTIEINPESASAWENSGIILYNLGEYNESIEAFNKAIGINKSHFYAWNNRGLSLYRLSDYRKAIESFDMALKINPQYADPWKNKGIVLYEWGIECNDSSKYHGAIEALKKAIEIHPEDSEALICRGKTLYQLSEYEDAIKDFKKAIEINPQDRDAWYCRGLVLYQLTEYSDAIAALNKATEIDPNYSDAWILKGLSFYWQNNHDNASEAFDKAIQIDPQDSNSWVYKSWPLYKKKNYIEAIKALDEAIKLDSTNGDAWNSRGLVLNASGRSFEANLAFENAMRLGYQR
jgi:tetratricopeptide (TPR) repeat protein